MYRVYNIGFSITVKKITTLNFLRVFFTKFEKDIMNRRGAIYITSHNDNANNVRLLRCEMTARRMYDAQEVQGASVKR